MENKDKLDALVIAPHPDDAELGMGGGILRMISQGMSVGILDLTDGEPTPHGDVETRIRETISASRVLGIKWRENLELPNRSLEPTLENRAALANVFRRTQPDWLFAPYWIDAHPDHTAATQLVEEARFWSKLTKSTLQGEPWHPKRIFNYYCVHLKMAANPDFILDISEYWENKFTAIKCFKSQFIVGREDVHPNFLVQLRNEASYWGKCIGVEYGEPYACREPIGLKGFTELV